MEDDERNNWNIQIGSRAEFEMSPDYKSLTVWSQNENFQCSQKWKFRQRNVIMVSVNELIENAQN